MEERVRAADRTDEVWLADLTGEEPGRGAALADLRSYLSRGLYAFLRSDRSDFATRDPGDVRQSAEDFTQDALLKIIDNLATFRRESRFLTWAMKIAVRTAISQLRRAAYRDLSLEELEARGTTMPLADTSLQQRSRGDPAREAEKREVLGLLRTAFADELSHKQRVALRATAIDGVPIEVTAGLLGTNRNALYKVVHDARRKLRDRFVTAGYTPEGVVTLFGGD